MDSLYKEELITALAAIQTCARICTDISRSENIVTEKDDFTIVTVADFVVQAFLITIFKAAFPNDRILGEEDATKLRDDTKLCETVLNYLNNQLNTPCSTGTYLPTNKERLCNIIDEAGRHSVTSRDPRTWIFDPIDGTRAFIRGEQYAINIALLIDGKQVFSAVGCPRTSISAKAPLTTRDVDPLSKGCVVFAVKDHGAYASSFTDETSTLRPRKLHTLGSDINAIRFATKVSRVDHGLLDIHELVATQLSATYPGCDLLPWTLRWAMLAMGVGNTTVWVYKEKERRAKVWDHAGAMLLFEETGGKITDINGKSIDLSIGRELKGNVGFVAAAACCHARVLGVVRQVLSENGYGWMLD